MKKLFGIAMMAGMLVGVGSASAHNNLGSSDYYRMVPYYYAVPSYHVPQTVRRCMWEQAWEWLPYARTSGSSLRPSTRGRYVLTKKKVCRDYLN